MAALDLKSNLKCNCLHKGRIFPYQSSNRLLLQAANSRRGRKITEKSDPCHIEPDLSVCFCFIKELSPFSVTWFKCTI